MLPEDWRQQLPVRQRDPAVVELPVFAGPLDLGLHRQATRSATVAVGGLIAVVVIIQQKLE